jgi:solute carrier family 13 (sodium-dependent dicarboxylate transporter), member 2/3/5
MSAGAKAGAAAHAAPHAGKTSLRPYKVLFCALAPIAVYLIPFAASPEIKASLAVSALMIAAWMTEATDYSTAGLFGLALFWFLGIAESETVFSGFVNDAAWFYFGAMLIGAMATKSGLPQRIGNFVVTRIGATYSRLLLGLILIDYLLIFLVPNGVAVLVILSSVALGIMKVFGAGKGSNIGRGLFLSLTYGTGIFNKMIVAGAASILARSMIQTSGGAAVSWGMWFAAFLPTALVTIWASWWIALKLFPPETATIAGREHELHAQFQDQTPWTPLSVKATILCLAALALWMTDWAHHIPAALVALAIGLIALLPYVDILEESDFKKINLTPFFFIAAALGMGNVLKETGTLDLLGASVVSFLEPLLSDRIVAAAALYWGGFVYHFFTASELSMLATSLPVLMDYAKVHNLDPVFIGMIWSFSSGGKLFAYQSAVLVVGYGYGYFRHTDLIKLGFLLTAAQFAALAVSVALYWPLLGL